MTTIIGVTMVQRSSLEKTSRFADTLIKPTSYAILHQQMKSSFMTRFPCCASTPHEARVQLAHEVRHFGIPRGTQR